MAVALFGLLLTVWLTARKFTGALLVGILATTALAIAVNAGTAGRAFPLPGQAVWPTTLVAMPDFSSLGAGFDLSVFVRLGLITALVTIFSLMLSDFFDTMGTVIGIGGEAGWLTPDGRLPRLNRVLLVDSLGAVAGGAAGASSATTYIEAPPGSRRARRRGWPPSSPACSSSRSSSRLAGVVPAEATASALIVVGYLRAAWSGGSPSATSRRASRPPDLTMMAFTYSITNGIGAGVVTYSLIKLVRGRRRRCLP